MTIQDVLAMLGGLAVFMFGMHTLSASLEKLAGGRLEHWLEKMTSNPVKGVALGAGVTALIQSSAATTVMMVGFVNSGLMKLSQAIGVIMGANVGTTATGWILSLSAIEGSGIAAIFNPTNFTPVIAIIGTVLIMFTKSDKKKTVGTLMLGFSLLMFGMSAMSGAAEGLKDNETFANVMVMFSNPFLGVLVGALLTAVLQSSSVSIGILQTLSNQTGTITYSIALPIILGQNIGSCVTALISSIGANKSAKRVAIVHLYFNVIGTIVFLSLFYIINAFVDLPFMQQTLSSVGIAVIHTCFNVLATLLFIPFTKQLEKLACLTVRDTPEDAEREVPMLDKRFLNTPSVAIEQCKNVAFKMAKLTPFQQPERTQIEHKVPGTRPVPGECAGKYQLQGALRRKAEGIHGKEKRIHRLTHPFPVCAVKAPASDPAPADGKRGSRSRRRAPLARPECCAHGRG